MTTRAIVKRMSEEIVRLRRERVELIAALKDIRQHANHARKHGVAEPAFESIRDKTAALLANLK